MSGDFLYIMVGNGGDFINIPSQPFDCLSQAYEVSVRDVTVLAGGWDNVRPGKTNKIQLRSVEKTTTCYIKPGYYTDYRVLVKEINAQIDKHPSEIGYIGFVPHDNELTKDDDDDMPPPPPPQTPPHKTDKWLKRKRDEIVDAQKEIDGIKIKQVELNTEIDENRFKIQFYSEKNKEAISLGQRLRNEQQIERYISENEILYRQRNIIATRLTELNSIINNIEQEIETTPVKTLYRHKSEAWLLYTRSLQAWLVKKIAATTKHDEESYETWLLNLNTQIKYSIIDASPTPTTWKQPFASTTKYLYQQFELAYLYHYIIYEANMKQFTRRYNEIVQGQLKDIMELAPKTIADHYDFDDNSNVELNVIRQIYRWCEDVIIEPPPSPPPPQPSTTTTTMQQTSGRLILYEESSGNILLYYTSKSKSKLKFSKEMAYTLGIIDRFGESNPWLLDGWWTRQIDSFIISRNNVSMLWIFADFIECMTVGDKSLPLLKVIPVDVESGMLLHNVFVMTDYRPVVRQHLKQLRICIKDGLNSTININSQVILSLHFRRV